MSGDISPRAEEIFGKPLGSRRLDPLAIADPYAALREAHGQSSVYRELLQQALAALASSTGRLERMTDTIALQRETIEHQGREIVRLTDALREARR